MRSTLLLALTSLLLTACPPEEVLEDPDVIWDPALDTEETGTLDLGDVAIGETASQTISATNNTDEDLTFTLDVGLDAADGFLLTFPSGDITLAPDAEYAFQVRLNPSQAGSYGGFVDYVFDNRIVSWTVTSNVQ